MLVMDTVNWLTRPVKGFLLDISGVLADFAGGTTSAAHGIAGSAQAVEKLRRHRIPFLFVTNDTQKTRSILLDKLNKLGFGVSGVEEIFSPAPAALKMIKERKLRPQFLIHPNLSPEFVTLPPSKEQPNCVVIGDAAEHFTYDNMNAAFNYLFALEPENRVLISMGRGRYYKETDGLKLDVGAYCAALEYALDIKADVVGKPSETYFNEALKVINLDAREVVMIGDDVRSDVGGAQQAGMRGVLVKTGKYRPGDESRYNVKPDGLVECLDHAIDLFFSARAETLGKDLNFQHENIEP